MKHHYNDIRRHIPAAPIWFDDHGAPRYDKFEPDLTADIYAEEAVLLLVECQNCGHPFDVCMTWSRHDADLASSLTDRAAVNALEYGDPPNIECCLSGPTMNSVPVTVLEFWRKSDPRTGWSRVPGLERPIDCEWMKE